MSRPVDDLMHVKLRLARWFMPLALAIMFAMRVIGRRRWLTAVLERAIAAAVVVDEVI